jgi:hypothetical protein
VTTEKLNERIYKKMWGIGCMIKTAKQIKGPKKNQEEDIPDVSVWKNDDKEDQESISYDVTLMTIKHPII